MSRDAAYRQCHLRRPTDDGVVELTTWLPERHKGVDIAPGVQLTLKDHVSGSDVDGVWEVVSVSETTQSATDAHKRAHMWTKYRDATDS
jgi:hypothetical protein